MDEIIIRQVRFTSGLIESGFVHVDSSHQIVLFTDLAGNELLTYESWYPEDE